LNFCFVVIFITLYTLPKQKLIDFTLLIYKIIEDIPAIYLYKSLNLVMINYLFFMKLFAYPIITIQTSVREIFEVTCNLKIVLTIYFEKLILQAKTPIF
jgi:hypothetical protein